MAYHREHGLRTRIVRIFNTYGPRMALDDGRVVPNFIGQALRGDPITVYGDGSQTRSFTYVSDLVEGIVRLLHSDEVYPVNLGNTVEITMLEYAEVIKRLTGTSSPIVLVQPSHERIADDPKQRKPDTTRAQIILGWEAKVALKEGMRETIEYFKQQLALPVG